MKILFLTHRLPYAPNRGDCIRAFHLMREMAQVGDVSLFSLVHDDEEAAEVGRVPFAREVMSARVPRFRNLVSGAARWLSARPLTHALLDAPDAVPVLGRLVAASPPDVVVAYCSGMARFALQPPLAGLPFVLDMVDVDSVKWKDMAARAAGPRRWAFEREARTLSAFEAMATTRAAETLVVNERERDALRLTAPAAKIRIVRNGIDLAAFGPRFDPSPDPVVVFCGVMNYAPNAEGAIWFAREVWPAVKVACPDARFVIVGARPTAQVRALASDPSIKVVGAVPEVQPYLWQSAVSVAPIHMARGLQNKVLEGLAAGLPTVVTPAVAGGLPQAARAGCLVGADARAFGDSVVQLLKLTPAARRSFAAEARLTGLGWSEALRDVASVLRNAAAHGLGAGAGPRRARA